MQRNFILGFVALGMVTGIGFQNAYAGGISHGSDNTCAMRRIVLTSPDGKQVLRINAEQAITDETRQKGLMYRKSMPYDQGMIFYWEEPQPIYMWMKNTYIPLDMVFALNGKVTGVVEASETESERVLTVEGNTDTVLEVNLGVATSKGVTTGWTIKPAGCIETTQ